MFLRFNFVIQILFKFIMKKITRISTRYGHVILESLIAVTIISVILLTLMDSLFAIFRIQLKTNHRIQATEYAIEGMEVVHSLNANRSWANFNAMADPDTIYYPQFVPVQQLTEVVSLGENVVDNLYTREVILAPGYRDDDGLPTETGGTIDPDMVRASVKVSWIDDDQSFEVELVNLFVKQEFN